MRVTLAILALALTACSTTRAPVAPTPAQRFTPDAAATDTAARRQAVALAATVEAHPGAGATPTVSGQQALATVVAAATEIARLRALPPDPTAPPTPVLPLNVAATDEAPAYRIVVWKRLDLDPRRIAYGLDMVVPDAYKRDQVLAVASSGVHRIFDTVPDAKALHARVIQQSGWASQFGGVVAIADRATDGKNFSGSKPQDSNMHVAYIGSGEQPGDGDISVEF
jgi:hypothetical protein